MRSSAAVIFAAGAVALAAAGFGPASGGPTFSKGDLPRVVAPKPPMPKHTSWLDVTTSDGDSRAVGLETLFDPGPLLRRLRKAPFQWGYHMVWSAHTLEPYDYRTAAAYALLFHTVSGARTAHAVLRRYIPKQEPSAMLLRAAELGSESFGLRSPNVDEPSAFFAWRIGNLILLAQAYCDVKCRFAVIPVARAFADALDANAKRKP